MKEVMKNFAPSSNNQPILVFSIVFVFALFCFSVPGQAAGSGEIEFVYVPPYGTWGDLTGEVSGVNPADYSVLVYIYVSGWWTKPTWAEPLTPINSDGTWTCNITTGGVSDTTATEIIAFLIPTADYTSSWERSGQASLPAELYEYPYADIPRRPADRAIHFSGHNWSVKHGDELGPGPNYFSDSQENVWLDGNGYLHLKIAYRDGHWYCSEIIADESFGYGTYVFTVESRLDLLDRNIILGLFTWDTYAPEYNYREIDFEFGTWGDPANDNAQYVIQPWDGPGNIYRFDIDYSGPIETTTHVMTWRADGIYFRSFYGDFALAPPLENFIESWYYTGGDNPPPGGENPRLNFWLIYGWSPFNGQDAEVVIKDFQYLTDISDRLADIDNDDNVNFADFSALGAKWREDGCNARNNWCNRTDLNCNGDVDLKDLRLLAAYWLAGVVP